VRYAAVRALLLADPERRLSLADIRARTGAGRALVGRVISDLLAEGAIPRRGIKGSVPVTPQIAAALAANVESVRQIAARFNVSQVYVYQVRSEVAAAAHREYRDG
jgi:hypothetical protein